MTESTLPALGLEAPVSPRLRDRLARRLVLRALEGLRDGALELREPGGAVHRFGDGDAGLRATIQVRSPRVWSAVATGGSLGGAEAFLRGEWDCDDLPALVRLVLRNPAGMGRLEGRVAPLRGALEGLARPLRSNTRRRSRRRIAAHYDLGNDFFGLFLDPTLSYSCALFETPEAGLEQAQEAKIARLCGWLDLSPQDHLLEIGTGWGALALHAARHSGCRVTTTTLSREQAELARERVAEAGLADRVEVLLEDYRDLRGRYDKLVSVEMIEAVGHEYFDTYFRRCQELLRPDGLMALQAIVIDDAHYEAARRHEDFIKRYVFPGGCLPSLEVLTRCLARTDLRVLQLEDVTPHYAETLRRWRARFHERAEEAAALGAPETFRRLWDYYLAYCEGGFEERHIGAVQLRCARSAWRPRPVASRRGHAWHGSGRIDAARTRV